RAVLEINDLLHAYAEAKTHCPEGADRGPKPPIAPGGSIENITSNDPNEIYGPAGVGDQKWSPRSHALAHSIRLANLGPRSRPPRGPQPGRPPRRVGRALPAPPPAVDVNAVTLGGFGWGKVELDVPAGRTTYHTEAPLADGDFVRVDGAVDKAARRITWTLAT